MGLVQLESKKGFTGGCIGGSLLLFELELATNTEMILKQGLRRYRQKDMFLDKWVLEVSCHRKGIRVKEA